LKIPSKRLTRDTKEITRNFGNPTPGTPYLPSLRWIGSWELREKFPEREDGAPRSADNK
jgi:hypothetical protein